VSELASAGSITDVAGIRVGHWTDEAAATGCTVVLCPPGTAGSVDVKGGAPGTRETDALRPGTLTPEVHAIVLTGGSAFGLAAADGVVAWLAERDIGFDTDIARVPIVPAAVLFDLGIGDASVRPDAAAGRAACEAAMSGPVEEGSVGAGTGATVAKDPDPSAGWKGGIGTSSASDGEVVVGAVAAVNALGAIVADDGTPIAVNRSPQAGAEPSGGTNTTLVVVATNARLSKERANLLAQAGSEAIAAAVRPSHTLRDGDCVFAVGTGQVEAPQPVIERLAIAVTADAIRRGVRTAASLGGVPAIRDATAGGEPPPWTPPPSGAAEPSAADLVEQPTLPGAEPPDATR
jgi:L-aminopeptidase/D-esterase-like protein